MVTWQRNEPVASLRRCDLLVTKNTGELAPRETDFIALGMVFVCRSASPNYSLATGTMTNKRRPLDAAADVVESEDTGADTLTLTAHAYETGDGPFISDEALGTIAIGVDFWVRVIGVDTIAIYPTLADAYADTNRVALTGTEDGATISKKEAGGLVLTQRGLDGHFTYEAPQVETDVQLPHVSIIVDGPNYQRSLGAGAYTNVTIDQGGANVLDAVLGDGVTVREALLGKVRTAAAPFRREVQLGGGVKITFRNLADTKDSHHATLVDAGRIDADIDDWT